MPTNINFNTVLGISKGCSLVCPSETAFDTTSWALGGLDDYLANTVPFDTITADPGSGADRKWTIAFWVKVDNLAATQYLYHIRDISGTLVQQLTLGTTGQLQAFMTGSGSNWTRSPVGAITIGNWHFVTMVYNGTLSRYTRQKVYVDADRTGATSNFFSANHAQSYYINLGSAGTLSNFLGGNLNEIAFWYGTALTQAQVTSIYNAGGPALDLNTIDGLPSPTHWFRSENAVWSGPNPGGEHYLMDDEMGTPKKIRTNNMPESSKEEDVPT